MLTRRRHILIAVVVLAHCSLVLAAPGSMPRTAQPPAPQPPTSSRRTAAAFDRPAQPAQLIQAPKNQTPEIQAPEPLPSVEGPPRLVRPEDMRQLRQPEQIVAGVRSDGQTLDDLVRIAMSNSPSLRRAANQAAAARGRAVQAGLYPNPTVGTASPQLNGDQTQYNVYMIQDVVTKGKLRLSSEAAWREARQAELDWTQTHYEVLTLVRDRFYTVLAAQLRVEILESLVDLTRKSRDVGLRLFQGGDGTRTDAIMLDIEFDRQDVTLQNARILLEAAKHQLAAGVGLPALSIPRVQGDIQAQLQLYDIMTAEQQVMYRNAAARSAEVGISRSQFVLQRARVEPFPNLNMMGGYQYQLPGALAPVNQGIYQMQVVVPLFNRNQGNIRAAEAGVSAAAAELGRVRNELAATTADAVGRYLTAQQLVDRYEEQILPKAREAQRLNQQIYAEGQSDFLRLLSAQRILVEANLAYVNAQEDRWAAAAEVAGLLQLDRFP